MEVLKQLQIFFLIALSLVTANAAYAQESVFNRVIKTKTINCGYIIAPPYIIQDVNTGKISGINVEMVEALGRNLGITINWALEVGVGDVAAALSARKIDVMCQTIWPSAARFTGMTFANRPLFYSAVYAVARFVDHRFDGDIAKANEPSVMGVGIEGDFSADMLNEKLPHAKHLLLAGSASLADYFMQLTTKKADILFMDKGSVTDFSKTHPGMIRIIENIPPARVFGEHLVVKMGEYKLRDMLDIATLQLVNDGVFDAIVEKYKREYKADIYASQGDIKNNSL